MVSFVFPFVGILVVLATCVCQSGIGRSTCISVYLMSACYHISTILFLRHSWLVKDTVGSQCATSEYLSSKSKKSTPLQLHPIIARHLCGFLFHCCSTLLSIDHNYPMSKKPMEKGNVKTYVIHQHVSD